MSDENNLDNLSEDDVESTLSSAVPKSKKIGLLPGLLKWIALVLMALIFVITVVVITVTVVFGKGKTQTPYPTSEEYRDSREILQYYQAIGEIKTITTDSPPSTIIVEVALGYTNNDKATPQELTARLVELKDYLRSYFQSKPISELRQEEKLKIEIRNEINDNILSKTKIKNVRFTKYTIVEP